MAAECTIRMHSKASPEAIYDVLADLNTHLIWNGEQQAKDFRLLSLSAEPGPANVGAVFESTGLIPLSRRIWKDTSTVATAQRPGLFEFRTHGVVDFGNGTGMDTTFLHRYSLEAEREGTRVSYTMRLESLKNGMWRISLPLLRTLLWKVGIPMATRPGLKNLLRMAEGASAQHAAGPLSA